jgi:hypothetical protein
MKSRGVFIMVFLLILLKLGPLLGDSLKVHEGAFRMLYEKRTGRTIAPGTLLPVKRLLANIPEIGNELSDAGLGPSRIGGLMHMAASDGAQVWPIIALWIDPNSLGTATTALLESIFEQVDLQLELWMNLRDHFGVSRRSNSRPVLYQSIQTVPNDSSEGINQTGALDITWKIRDLLGLRTSEAWDAHFVPSIYKQSLVVMPPSLCRYAIAFYASSLVRYRPFMFDSEKYPEQAYMFDAIARECALPMLIDTLSGLEGEDQWFYSADSMRL